MLMKRMMRLCSVAALIAIMGFNAITFAGGLEPTAPPAPTMKSLDEIPPTWSQKLPGADRFELVLDGAGVLDKETGLVWEQSPGLAIYTFNEALFHCYTSVVGERGGWHLPSIEQLTSLKDTVNSDPSLPTDHPFSNVQSSGYHSSTTYASDNPIWNIVDAWGVNFNHGIVWHGNKGVDAYAWCVRGGQTYDTNFE